MAPDAASSTEPAAPTEPDEEAPLAPPVVAVVVAHEPGPWFDECVASIAGQDYPNLSTLVIATGDDGAAPGAGLTAGARTVSGVTDRVARVLPAAYVRAVDADRGFGPAANEVLAVVEGAAFYVFCHDDVALAPGAIRSLVEEAFRSNAGIVTPKFVDWDEPARLLSVGESVDKTGVRAALVEPGELDQEQHDAVRDVFCAPGGCTLVRADLFAVLGGFDPAIDLVGEDLDLSWRAQVAGARVVAAPAAVVRHVEASSGARLIATQDLRAERHRVRTMLTCYGRVHLLRVLPQAIVLALAQICYALVSGRRGHARDVLAAWRWNFEHRGDIVEQRKRLARIRQLPDSEVRRLQVRGSAQLGRLLRPTRGGDDEALSPVASAGRELAGSLRSGPARSALLVWVAIVAVLVIGSRQLLTGNLVAFGDLPAFPARPWTLFTEWFSGWRDAGLGSESPAPTAFALLGALGIAFLGAMSALRRFLLLVLLPVGVAGSWRLARVTGSTIARLVAVITYLAIPLPYDAIARGRWGGLLLWAAAPWIVDVLAARAGAAPFVGRRIARRTAKRTALGLGIAVAVLAAFVPIVLVVVAVVAVGLAAGGLVVGQPRGGGRILGVALGSVAVAVVLHVPWAFDFALPGGQWAAFGGVQSLGARLDLGMLLRFQTGPIGGSPFGWVFLVVAALPLVVGRDWRFAWAARAWVLALTCWTAAWIGQQTWFGRALGPPEALLAPAAAALAFSAALGLVAFESDLRGYRFGWRQVASLVAATALAIGVVPVFNAMFDGRWNAPDEGFDGVLGFVNAEQASAGPFRVVWLGDPDVLPLSGWRLDAGVSYATTDSGLPTVEDRWAGSSDGATSLVGDALHLAERRETSRLGRLLAPMGVRYVVVQTAAAPADEPDRALPGGLEQSLGEQLDLQQVLADPHVRVYRNVAWAPIRTVLSPAARQAAARGPFFDVISGVDLSGSPPVLTDHSGFASASGHVDDRTDVYLASASSPRWSLAVDGRPVPRTKAFGWANSFAVEQGGSAKLRFSTSVQRYGLLLLEVALWAWAIATWWRWRRREPAR